MGSWAGHQPCTACERPPVFYADRRRCRAVRGLVPWGAGFGKPVSQGGEKINPLTGEVEEEAGGTALTGAALEDGMEVLCAGRLNVFEPRGQYQLVAELVQDQGVGDLSVAFEALKKKLAEKGYFDEDRKIALPRDPVRVAVITSPSGAAVRDFLRIAKTRGTGSEIRIYPSLVQGDQAPEQIAAALDMVDADDWAEVAVLIRGGGSLEDLWAFNTEPVADAIYRARVPVVSGIGHEPDVSIADSWRTSGLPRRVMRHRNCGPARDSFSGIGCR